MNKPIQEQSDNTKNNADYEDEIDQGELKQYCELIVNDNLFM